MTASLTFLGATRTVTGSRFLVADSAGGQTLVDCGLYQGLRELRRRNWAEANPPADTINSVVLTHAHLDHSGYLPALVRQGYPGSITCTQGSADLATIVLRDSAHLQEEDARVAREKGYSKHDPPMPLYDSSDAEQAITRFEAHGFGQSVELTSRARVTLHRAGHILGSASAHVEVGETSVLFSGDLGRPAHPLLLEREDPPAAHTVVIESTYGDREHPQPQPIEDTPLAQAIRRTIGRGGTVVVPAFAVDRTEIILAELAQLVEQGSIPRVPVYVDSPMALASLEAYRRAAGHGELRDGVLDQIDQALDLRAASSVDESIELNDPKHPCIIISASGMASGGRVVHHLQHLLPDPRNSVVLTGYQAVGTRGRALQDGAMTLKMYGRYVSVRAEIVKDEHYSVHADASELVDWLRAIPEPPQAVYIVHGEENSSLALAQRLEQETGWCVVVPKLGEKVRLT